jgi:hypothetical protein
VARHRRPHDALDVLTGPQRIRFFEGREPMMRFGGEYRACLLAAASLFATCVCAADPPGGNAAEPWLRPYAGADPRGRRCDDARRQSPVRLPGLVQHPQRRHGLGFTHWGQGLDRPGGGRFTIDLWPDVSEYDSKDWREVPGLTMPDGSSAKLYSAFRKGPVLLHCKWMRQYGIDGVFLSRFIGEATSPARSRHVNRVLANVREGCHREGRVRAMMLDLATGRNATTTAVMDDWKFLCDKVRVREDDLKTRKTGDSTV